MPLIVFKSVCSIADKKQCATSSAASSCINGTCHPLPDGSTTCLCPENGSWLLDIDKKICQSKKYQYLFSFIVFLMFMFMCLQNYLSTCLRSNIRFSRIKYSFFLLVCMTKVFMSVYMSTSRFVCLFYLYRILWMCFLSFCLLSILLSVHFLLL